MRAVAYPFVLSLAGSLLAACSAFDDAPVQPICHDIPAGGCLPPASNCADPSCLAIYQCEVDGGWAHLATCPVPEGGRPDARLMYPDARLNRDVDWDVPEGASGGPGCVDLSCGDCPLGVAIDCPSNTCCGCSSLFVCSDGGWDLWGYCDEAGAIVRNASPSADR